MLRWLKARAIPGVEEVAGDVYRRTLRLSAPASASLRPDDGGVEVRLWAAGEVDADAAVAACRCLFDLEADPGAHGPVLAADPALTPLVRADPGLRVPGTVDPEETAIRAVLGQQVSLAAARTLAARLVVACGPPLPEPDGALTHAFPAPASVSADAVAVLGMPRTRQRTLVELCARLAAGSLRLDPGSDGAEARRRLLAIPGIGPWTADYVALRALGDRDAFPAGDLGIRRGARALGLPDDPRALEARSERWRPWRAYAAHHLWAVAANRT